MFFFLGKIYRKSKDTRFKELKDFRCVLNFNIGVIKGFVIILLVLEKYNLVFKDDNYRFLGILEN